MRSGGRPRTEVPKLGHPTGKDVVAGFVPVCSAFPKGWPRQHRWLNPVLGLYSGMAPTLVGAVFARTVLMTTTLTSAVALSARACSPKQVSIRPLPGTSPP